MDPLIKNSYSKAFKIIREFIELDEMDKPFNWGRDKDLKKLQEGDPEFAPDYDLWNP